MKLDIQIDNITLEIICRRLKNVVAPLDILKWLTNFEKADVKYAISILENLVVYTTHEIEETLNNSFEKLFAANNEKIIVLPVGEFGKSGSMVGYFFQKTTFYKKNESRIKLIAAVDQVILGDTKDNLVLLDDFVGTGKTVIDFYANTINANKNHFSNIYLICTAGMEFAINRVRPLFKGIMIQKSNIFKKAFARDASYFGYRNYSTYRDFAYKYGKKITGSKKGNHSLNWPDALGFQNSQALVAFSYGSPNNTLPIIWANRADWYPLIPRFSKDKLSAGQRFRKNIAYELSILKEFGGENIVDHFFSFSVKIGKRNFTSVSKIDFSLYSIIKLSRMGFSSVSICHRLGIFYSDYEAILRDGTKRGIFENDKDCILTDFGLELYRDVKKCIQANVKSIKYEMKDQFTFKPINYIPKRFNGRS